MGDLPRVFIFYIENGHVTNFWWSQVLFSGAYCRFLLWDHVLDMLCRSASFLGTSHNTAHDAHLAVGALVGSQIGYLLLWGDHDHGFRLDLVDFQSTLLFQGFSKSGPFDIVNRAITAFKLSFFGANLELESTLSDDSSYRWRGASDALSVFSCSTQRWVQDFLSDLLLEFDLSLLLESTIDLALILKFDQLEHVVVFLNCFQF